MTRLDNVLFVSLNCAAEDEVGDVVELTGDLEIHGTRGTIGRNFCLRSYSPTIWGGVLQMSELLAAEEYIVAPFCLYEQEANALRELGGMLTDHVEAAIKLYLRSDHQGLVQISCAMDPGRRSMCGLRRAFMTGSWIVGHTIRWAKRYSSTLTISGR